MLSSHSYVNNSLFMGKHAGPVEENGLCLPVQMHHVITLLGFIWAFLSGYRIVFPCYGYDPKGTSQVLKENPCSVMIGSPTIHYDIAEKGGDNQLTTLIYAGAPCNQTQRDSIEQGFPNAKVICMYGTSETAAVFVNGHVIDHLEVKLEGDNGELSVRGFAVTQGYWRNPEKTRESLNDAGWFQTGDICRIGENGAHCEVTGRARELVNRGGEKVFPKEVEDVLTRMAAVEEAVVFGVESPRFGEELAAWIKPAEDTTDLEVNEVRDFCKGKLAHFKVPSNIHITQDIPKTYLGKPKRKEMAEKTIAEAQ